MNEKVDLRDGEVKMSRFELFIESLNKELDDYRIITNSINDRLYKLTHVSDLIIKKENEILDVGDDSLFSKLEENIQVLRCINSDLKIIEKVVTECL